MIYLDNTTSPQNVWIPRNDGNGYVHTGSSQSYQEGYEDGIEYQKSLLSSYAFTENGEYERENGWSAITVNVEPSLEEINVVISADTTTITPSSGYEGFSAVTVDATEYGQENYDSGFDDGFTDGYSSGTSEGYDSGYTEGYQSGSTDGFNSGYTSGETHQKSLLVSTAITQNGSYSRENGYSAITVNVPTGQTYNIEANHSFTATTNGNYTITPTSASTTVTDHFDRDNDRYYLTATTSGYPSTGYFELFLIEDEFDSSKGSIEVYFVNGSLDYDDSDWYGGEVDWDSYGNNELELVVYDANNGFGYTMLSDFNYSYDVMSAVSLNVNIDTASTYQSGYTSGHTDGVSEEKAKLSATTFTANTAITISDGGYSAITVNVPQSGSTEKDIVICTSGGCWFNMNYQIGYGDVFEIEHCTFGKAGVVSFAHQQYLGGNSGELFRIGQSDVDLYIKYFNNSIQLYTQFPQSGSIFEDNTIVYSSTAFTVDGNIVSSYTTNYSSRKGTLIVFANTTSGGDKVENQTAKIGRLKVYASDGTLKATFEPRLDEFNVPYFKYIEQDIDIYASGNTAPFYEEIIIDSSYQSGYTDGQNSIISTFTAMTATTNGVYGSSASPYSSITVNVPQTGSSATLGVGSFSANGTYSASTDNLDGYSAITINVPTSGGGSDVRYVEYLETDGTKYGWQIPLNVNRNTKIEMDFMPFNGSPNSDGWYNFFITNGNQSNLTTYWGGYSLDDVGGSFLGGEFVPRTSFSSGTRYLFTIEKRSVKVDNVQIATVTPQSLNASSSTIYINSSSDFQRSPIARYYGFKAYENGTLVWDLRPCLDQNNNPCFYEVISGIYYYHTKFDSSQGDPIDPSYKNGYTDGVDYQKSLLTSYTAYTDGVYSTENGYSAFTVAVPPIIAYSRVFSANGIYNPSDYNCDYWSTIQIDVPQSGGGSSDINKLIDRSITSIEIPSGVTTIGTYAFGYCDSLTAVTMPNTLTSIGSSAFYFCSHLTSIVIPSGVTSIGSAAFKYCANLNTIYIYAPTAPTLSSTSSSAQFGGVSSTGTVHYPQGSDYSSWQSARGISGWTFVGDL